MADYEKSNLEIAEKPTVIGTSDIESSGISSPPEYDDLPDPDVGKTDEERAKLVRRPQPSILTQY